MDRQKKKAVRRRRRRIHIRKRVVGTSERPRLCVYRSLRHTYAQIIDDMAGRTLCAASTRDPDLKLEATGNADAAQAVGAKLAEKAKAAGIARVAFDRGGFAYHGRIRALAEAARKGGLEF